MITKNSCREVEYSVAPVDGYVEPEVDLPVTPFVDDLYVPPVVRPKYNKSEDESRLKMWMIPAQARLGRAHLHALFDNRAGR